MVVPQLLDSLRDPHVDLVFGALADPTRRDILRCVLHEPESVSSLARRYPMSLTAVQKHVLVLERADLVRKRRRGREQLAEGRLEALHRAARLLDELEQVWRDRLGRFEALLDEPPAELIEARSPDRPPKTPPSPLPPPPPSPEKHQ